MATSIAYVVLKGLLARDDAGGGIKEDEASIGLWVDASFATVSPGNKSGIMGCVRVPFNYGDDDDAIFEAVEVLVIDAVQEETGVAPRVRFIGRQS